MTMNKPRREKVWVKTGEQPSWGTLLQSPKKNHRRVGQCQVQKTLRRKKYKTVVRNLMIF